MAIFERNHNIIGSKYKKHGYFYIQQYEKNIRIITLKHIISNSVFAKISDLTHKHTDRMII